MDILDADPEYELCCLTKKYEALGFKYYFYLEKGSLACDDYDLGANKPVISVYESCYYPRRQPIPHGFCLYAITVDTSSHLLKGIFLLPQGLLTTAQVSPDLEQQLQLNHLYPHILTTAL